MNHIEHTPQSPDIGEKVIIDGIETPITFAKNGIVGFEFRGQEMTLPESLFSRLRDGWGFKGPYELVPEQRTIDLIRECMPTGKEAAEIAVALGELGFETARQTAYAAFTAAEIGIDATRNRIKSWWDKSQRFSSMHP